MNSGDDVTKPGYCVIHAAVKVTKPHDDVISVGAEVPKAGDDIMHFEDAVMRIIIQSVLKLLIITLHSVHLGYTVNTVI